MKTRLKHTALPYLFVVLCLALSFDVAGAQPTLRALSYILMDVDTGRVLAAHDEHTRRFPASTTKTMTALVAIEKGDLNRVVSIGPNPPKTGEASIGLMQGETFVLHELVEAALIKSANDSCVAIAEAVAGTLPKFVEMMNQKARAVNVKDTHFVNPHGLHNPNHYTTAYDLALIARDALKYPVFNEIIATKETTIHGNAKVGALRPLHNRNRLLFRWAECDGVKTGYTRQAGRCLIASATRIDPATHRPWRLLCVVLHSPDSWAESRQLIEWGFHNYKPTIVAHGGETLTTIDAEGGSTPVQAIAAHEIRLPLRAGEQQRISTRISSLQPEAPVAKDQPVASLVCLINGKKVGVVPLVARDAVSKSLVVRVVPAAAPVIPSRPLLRWAMYSCAILGLFFLATGLKAYDNERKRELARARRHGARRLTG